MSEKPYVIKTSTVCFLITAFAYLAIVAGARSIFSATAGSDANTVAALAEAGEVGIGNSYAMTAWVYAKTPEGLRNPFTYLTGILFIWFCISKTRTAAEALTISFLCLAPCILSISTFQKDMLLVWFLVPLAYIMTRLGSRKIFIAIFVIYVSYAALFRTYFVMMPVFCVGIYLFANSGWQARLIIAGLALLILIATPVEILSELQLPRDQANYYRIFLHNREGARTAFMNPFEVTGVMTFLGNYIYAFWMIDFSLLNNAGLKELYLALNIVPYYSLVYYGLKSASKKSKLVASLILSHVIVLHFFEPDSGSYLRHFSSTLPFACVLLAIRRSERARLTNYSFFPWPSFLIEPNRAIFGRGASR